MGQIVTNPPSIPNSVSDSWQPLLDVNTMSFYGMNQVTLTNWDNSTTIPAVAQGSAIDINGSVARFTTTEAIGGSPADGTIYLKFTVSGATVTPVFTAEAPTWYANKAGWYNATGERYSGHLLWKHSGIYEDKRKLPSDGNMMNAYTTYFFDNIPVDSNDATVALSLYDVSNRLVSFWGSMKTSNPNSSWYSFNYPSGGTLHVNNGLMVLYTHDAQFAGGTARFWLVLRTV